MLMPSSWNGICHD